MAKVDPPRPVDTPLSEEEHAEIVCSTKRAASHVFRQIEAETGILFKSLNDLVESKGNFSDKLISTLLKLLDQTTNRTVYCALVRALGNDGAVGTATHKLAEHFELYAKSDPHLGWTIGNTLAYVTTPVQIDIILNLAHNKTYGKSREMLPDALSRCDEELAIAEAKKLLLDPNTRWMTLHVIKKRKFSDLIEDVRIIANETPSPIQRDAQKILLSLI